ncbi:hypothetical protein D081_1181 [Anaerovibrio sp. JC8]|nr:hypothetical protein D081_1181 [Anaerovibrio sp. JC8]
MSHLSAEKALTAAGGLPQVDAQKENIFLVRYLELAAKPAGIILFDLEPGLFNVPQGAGVKNTQGRVSEKNVT